MELERQELHQSIAERGVSMTDAAILERMIVRTHDLLISYTTEMRARVDKLEATGIADLKERFVKLEETSSQFAVLNSTVSTLDHKLYGNGQPGDIQGIKAGLDTLKAGYLKMLGAASVIVMLAQHFWKP